MPIPVCTAITTKRLGLTRISPFYSIIIHYGTRPKYDFGDPLNFRDTKAYTDRIKTTIAKTGLKDAVRTAHGQMNELNVTIACMDFGFIGGSMGRLLAKKLPVPLTILYNISSHF